MCGWIMAATVACEHGQVFVSLSCLVFETSFVLLYCSVVSAHASVKFPTSTCSRKAWPAAALVVVATGW
jgi:hypothetical protein